MFRISISLCAVLSLFVARIDAGTVLGSRLTEFYKVFGKPSYREDLGRTSEVQWTPPQRAKSGLAAARVVSMEVSVLDGVVCFVGLRCHRRLTDSETIRLAQLFLGRPYPAASFVAERRPDPETTEYTLTDGDHVKAGPHGIYFRGRRICHDDHYFVMITNRTYWRNNEVFDEEARKIFPPTSNH